MNESTEPRSAAESLEGYVLSDGWRVGPKLALHPNATGGCFSVGYEVTSETGERGFLKALDYAKGLGAMDPALELQIMTAGFQYEKEIPERCSRMNRVVSILSSGTTRVPGFPVEAVSYLVFEWADGDVRRFLDTSAWLDEARILRSLHDVAVGLQQLHTQRPCSP